MSIKKAKIFLSVMVLLSVVSGILASKAQHKFGGLWRCTTVKSGTCSGFFTTIGSNLRTSYCTNVADGTCTTTTKVKKL